MQKHVSHISDRSSCSRYTIAGHDLPVTVRAYEAAGDIENESFDLSVLAVSPRDEGKCNRARGLCRRIEK